MIRVVRPLWPETETPPVRRLVIAFVLAPLLMTILLAIGSALVAGMSTGTQTDLVAVITSSAVSLGAVVFLFALTFGVVGVLGLGAAGLRGVLPWAATGGLMGGVAGALYAIATEPADLQIMVLAVGLIGWVLFLMLRWLAGVKTPPRKSSV